jgi:hypothetical protein
MVMYRDQHAGQNHNIKIGNKSLERLVQNLVSLILLFKNIKIKLHIKL